MTDLENLAAFCRIKADDAQEPAIERRLWGQIAGEIGEYLSETDPAQAGLFEATS